MAEIVSIDTEKLIEQYTYYIDGKLQMSTERVQILEKELMGRSFNNICARKLLKIFQKCAKYPNLFS